MHAVAPTAPWNFPTSQLVHLPRSVSFDVYEPAEQYSHVPLLFCPANELKLPMGHSWHASAD